MHLLDRLRIVAFASPIFKLECLDVCPQLFLFHVLNVGTDRIVQLYQVEVVVVVGFIIWVQQVYDRVFVARSTPCAYFALERSLIKELAIGPDLKQIVAAEMLTESMVDNLGHNSTELHVFIEVAALDYFLELV